MLTKPLPRILIILMLTFAAVLPGFMPAAAQTCNSTAYIDQVVRDVNTVDTALSQANLSSASKAASSYIQIATLRRSYEDMTRLPDCVLVLHSLITQWMAAAQDEAALVLAIFADARNTTLYNQQRTLTNTRLTTLANAANNEIQRLEGSSVNPTPSTTTSADWYRVYFTQPINSNRSAAHTGAFIEQSLIFLIDNTQSTIDAALFEIDAPDTTAALIRALRRGVQVRLVLDNEHALEDPGSTVQQIIDAGATFRSDNRSALMHNKYFIFDSTTIWTGATNVTRNGIYNNNNNAILIRAPQLVANFQADFNKLFVDGLFNRNSTRAIPNRTFTIQGTRIETYFSPGDGRTAEARILELINGARSSIRVMAFSFTLRDLGQAMITRLQAGVSVEGLFETTGSLQGQMKPLGCAGAGVRQDSNPSIMHHKVIIIDDQIVVVGSFNFSNSAIENNNENLLIIQNAEIAAAYTREFRTLFDAGRVPANLGC